MNLSKSELPEKFDNDIQQLPCDVSAGELRKDGALKPVRQSGGILASLRYYENWLDWKMGVEPHGPARITPDKKRPVPIWAMACIWSSGTFSLSSITLGVYGWEYGLSFSQSVLTMLFGSLLGAFVAVS